MSMEAYTVACDHRPDAGAPDDPVTMSPSLTVRIDRARRSFVARAHGKIARATEITAQLGPDADADPALAELQDLAHSLCGTAGSFGYRRLSEIAGALEDATLSTRTRYFYIFRLVVALATEFLARVCEPRRRPAD